MAQFGAEEGTSTRIPDREFGLIVDEPAEFRFFCSASRKNDEPGALIEDFGDELEELSPVEVRLSSEQNSADVVPVSFETVITENRHAAALVRGARRTALEARVQCTGDGHLSQIAIFVSIVSVVRAYALIRGFEKACSCQRLDIGMDVAVVAPEGLGQSADAAGMIPVDVP